MCDWISVSQTHTDAATCTSTVSVIIDTESGDVEREVPKGHQIVGSFNTGILVTSFNGRVSLSGNVGRWCRPDNVFGFDVDTVKRRCNMILQKVGLPPFTDGAFHYVQNKEGEGQKKVYSGATISRLDLTVNYGTGSAKNSSDFRYWLSTQRLGRSPVTMDGNTVYYGKRSKYATLKVYDKAAEIRAHRKKSVWSPEQDSTDDYLKALADWCDSIGMIRVERILKSRALRQKDICYWSTMNNAVANVEFNSGVNEMRNRCEEFHDIEFLKPNEKALYHAYLRGENLRLYGYSRATFYRYKKILLAAGIDISEPLNVVALKVRPRIIELVPVEPPKFYETAVNF